MVILSESVYKSIIDLLKNHNGLNECEKDLAEKFPEIPHNTLQSISSKFSQNKIKEFYAKNHKNFTSILKEYERRVKDEWTIVEMSQNMRVPPLCICRMILNEKFSKPDVKEMMKNPDLIPDPMLSANVL